MATLLLLPAAVLTVGAPSRRRIALAPTSVFVTESATVGENWFLNKLDETQLDTHVKPKGVLWPSDRLVARAATYKTPN